MGRERAEKSLQESKQYREEWPGYVKCIILSSVILMVSLIYRSFVFLFFLM